MHAAAHSSVQNVQAGVPERVSRLPSAESRPFLAGCSKACRVDLCGGAPKGHNQEAHLLRDCVGRGALARHAAQQPTDLHQVVQRVVIAPRLYGVACAQAPRAGPLRRGVLHPARLRAEVVHRRAVAVQAQHRLVGLEAGARAGRARRARPRAAGALQRAWRITPAVSGGAGREVPAGLC